MEEAKKWWQSKAIWGGLIGGAASIAGILGVNIDAGSQQTLANGVQQLATVASSHDMASTVTSAVSLAGSVIAVYGRIKATRAIGK